jgi:hypothetical protein
VAGHGLHLEDGDIIIYQICPDPTLDPTPPYRFPKAPAFLEWTKNRRLVYFKKVSEPKEQGLRVELTGDSNYDEVRDVGQGGVGEEGVHTDPHLSYVFLPV